ncbi:DUF4339 domain-containing protein [Bradyrhizobium sp. 187]|nr:DUF4339 domain-containing protein [Bradyrhizobium sp. 187]
MTIDPRWVSFVATSIKDLLKKKEIETDTRVWRKGMPEWKPRPR